VNIQKDQGRLLQITIINSMNKFHVALRFQGVHSSFGALNASTFDTPRERPDVQTTIF
jgi:DNA-binding transcriptional regulator PaaX